MLSYQNVINERQWKAATGLSSKSFHTLSRHFEVCYRRLNQVSLEQTASNLKKSLLLPTYADCLFFVLFQLKTGLTYDNLGLLVQTDGSNAQRNFEKYLLVLEATLVELGAMPKRGFSNITEFESYFADERQIIIDASEQSTQRPKDTQAQKEAYSGKKTPYLQRTAYL